MQLFAALSAVSALSVLVPTVLATDDVTAVTLNAQCDLGQTHALITNSCNYPVYLWSVLKNMGCPSGAMFTLAPGGVYHENLRNGTASTGISIKMSKSQTCGGSDITQLEYFLNYDASYGGNYLDMSYIDCPGGDCPSRKEGYSLVAGSQTGNQVSSAGNTVCPVITCSDATSCAKYSYLLPDDVQTKSCTLDANMVLNLCGSQPASNNPSSAPASSKPAPAPSSTKPTSSAAPKAQAAAVTPAVELKDNVVKNIKTQVVYVTAVQTVNAKRHLHGHARRHQRFHA